MKEIQKKIQELLALQKGEKDYDRFEEVWQAQEKLFIELTSLAREHNTLLGRIIKYGIADGEAAYVIVKVNQKTVKLQWIDYVDGYCQYGLGEGSSNIDITEAYAQCNFEDYMDGRRKK